MTPFRFGLQSTIEQPVEAVRQAEQAEDAGFDIFQVGDHVGVEPTPLLSSGGRGGAHHRIRLGTLVLNNDLHHPVTLAQELATLDHLSGGRLEVGLGAGHSFTEYAAMGKAFDPPAVRKERLAESVEILRVLLGGRPVTFHGAHYDLEGATTLVPNRSTCPSSSESTGGRRSPMRPATPTSWPRRCSDGRWRTGSATTCGGRRRGWTTPWRRYAPTADASATPSELHALVQAVVVTDDRRAAVGDVARRTGMDEADIEVTPFVCLGTHEEMAEHLLACRERWGFSYFSVRDIEAFAPVIVLLRGC